MSSSKMGTFPILPLLLLLLILLSVTVNAQKSSPSSSDYDWDGTNPNVSPSMAIIVIVLVLGFFITACIFIYIQHCSSSATSAITTSSRAVTTTANTGLHQSLLDTFPIFQYSAVKELQLGKGALECAVCLSDFQDDETLRFLPNCDHVFHSDCIDTWLAGHHTCPVCRDDLTSAVSDKPLPALPISTIDIQITIQSQDQNQTTSFQNKRLPRSHSTGHSLIQPGENCERFTLRLPKEVRRQLLARARLRTTSLVVLPRQSSSRRGYRAGGEGSGSSRYGRFFGRSFLMRMGSFRTSTKVGIDGDLTAPVQKPMDRPQLPV